MKLGMNFKNIQCENDILVDGHHRYLCSILSKNEIGKRPYTAPRSAIKYEWKNLIIDQIDYDNDKARKKYNLQDSLKHKADKQTFNNLFK